jgi:SAM-dependent methyltransferase
MFDLSKIEEIAKGIDEHLRKLESFTGVLRDVKVSLALLKESQEKSYLYELNKIKKDVADLSESLKKYGLPQTSQYEKDLNEIRNLIDSQDWPLAVDPGLICDNEEKAQLRANSILDILVAENLKGKKFLDFGCGEGHTIPAAIEREAELAFGFDVSINKFKFDKQYVTDSFEIVRSHAPYDIILMHDVLDHIVVVDPIEALKNAASILSSEGRIYLRNHPWSARHGGHLYLQKNLAFLHLVLDETELMRCFGLEVEHNIKIVKPIETYRDWIVKAGLEAKSELPIKTKVEDFFTRPSLIHNKLTEKINKNEAIQNELEIDFVEYVLELPKENANKIIF